MIDLAHEPPFSLGAMQVYPATREVQRGADVRSVEPRVMQVLVALARRRGCVASRQDLIDMCWDGRIVSDDALNRCIGAIRRLSVSLGGFNITTIARVGYRLDALDSETSSASPPDAIGPRSERRHLTALACRLRRPVALDPEQENVFLRDYRRDVTEIVAALGGHVEDGPGAALTAYFGYPQAWEDAALRAVRAALAVVERAAVSGGAVQVGLHAAVVLVEHAPEQGTVIVGEAAELATRVQAEAAPGDVVMTEAVHDLVAGCVAVDERPALFLDGDRTLSLYRALSVHSHARARSLHTPFVGRDESLHLLHSRLNRACAGEGQLVLVIGESGIGKSRLMSELKARVPDAEPRWIECAGAPLFANTPFHAVAELLETVLGLRDLAASDRIQILECALERAGLRPSEAVPLIAELLNVPVPERFPPLMFAPEQRRKRQFAALLGWIFGLARDRPLVLVIEDLHWIDPSTLELIEMLAAQGATTRLLLLCTARPEFLPPWAARAHHAVLALDRLSVQETCALVGDAARAELPADAVDLVVQRSDGIPLLAEELTRLMLERGQRLGAREIPATLRDSLCARLDRLGQARDVAQLSAGIGREFSYELLHALSPLPEGELQAALTKLTDAELVYQRGLPPDASYRFRHTLIQDAAWEMLVKSARCALHARIARTITDAFPQLAEAQPELLARHWTEAGELERAIASWVKVATAARSRQAHTEAEEGYRRALALLASLPDSPERDLREAELVSELGSELQILRGGAAPEAVAALARSRALVEKSGDMGRQIALLLQSCLQSMVTGNIRDADRLAERLVELAERQGGDEIRAKAHQTRFFTLFYLGDASGAERHFGIWKQIWASGGYVQTYRVRDGLSYASLRAVISGHFELARERLREATAYAFNTGDPFEIAAAHTYESFMHNWLAEFGQGEVAASAALAACEAGGFGALASMARVSLGYARSQREGAAADSVALMRRGLTELIRIDYRLPVGGLTYLLAEALSSAGAHEEALATVNDALSFNPHEVAYRPQGLLIRGGLRFRLGQLELAEADFRDSIALARTTDAKLYELHAAHGFARLLQARGDVRAAREVLEPISASFRSSASEGVSYVRDALALLRDLQAY